MFLLKNARHRNLSRALEILLQAVKIFIENISDEFIFQLRLSDGVMVAHGPLEPLVLVRIQVGQPIF